MNKNIVKNIEILIGFCIAFFIFFGYILSNSYPLLYLIILLNFFLFISKKGKIIMNKNILLWTLTAGFLFMSSLFSLDISGGINLTITIILFIILITLMTSIKQEKWFTTFTRFIIILGSIHVIFTLSYQVYPELVENICKLILKPEDLEVNAYLFKHFGNPGITGQTGINGWYISILLGLLIVNLQSNSNCSNIKKTLYYTLTIASILAIFLTNKRAFILFTLASLIITLHFSKEKNKKKINFKKILPIILIVFVVITIIVKNNELITVIERFINSGDDISSGRYSLYRGMLTNFYEHPLLGVGTYSIPKILGNFGHNIYLEILAENGIIGLILFLITFYSEININIKLLRKYSKLEFSHHIRKNLTFSLYIQFLFLLYGLTGNPLYNIQFFSIYFIIIGYLNIMHVKGEELK